MSFQQEEHHKVSKRFLEELMEEGRLVTSSIALLEACNTICRKIVGEQNIKLVDPLQEYLDKFNTPLKQFLS